MTSREDNPWKTLSSRQVYQNAWIRVREDEVTRPDGRPGIYGVVETNAACGAVPLDAEGNVYLVGQYRYPLHCYSWEIIEGGAEPGEEPIEAMKRELAEEAGLAAEKWTPLGGEFHLSNCHSSECGYIFLAEGLTEVPKAPDATEVLQIKKLPLAEAVDMTLRGEITDAMSVIGLFWAERVVRGR